ncbi:hypothetical protein TNCV_4559881 [Trichonephila clavipes]|nr:hypothetical protein TNCV_4559881 [Trichonephila clavipes]
MRFQIQAPQDYWDKLYAVVETSKGFRFAQQPMVENVFVRHKVAVFTVALEETDLHYCSHLRAVIAHRAMDSRNAGCDNLYEYGSLRDNRHSEDGSSMPYF